MPTTQWPFVNFFLIDFDESLFPTNQLFIILFFSASLSSTLILIGFLSFILIVYL